MEGDAKSSESSINQDGSVDNKRPPELDDHSRDTIWEAIFKTYYDCYYEELMSSYLRRRWKIADDFTKVLVAITASGSAVSGWALWEKPEYKVVWTIFAGFGALVSVIHASLGVTKRLKDWDDKYRVFKKLRVEIETFRHEISIYSDFDVDDYFKKFEIIRKQYSSFSGNSDEDILRSRRVKRRIQYDLNKLLEHDIEPDNTKKAKIISKVVAFAMCFIVLSGIIYLSL